MLLSADQLRVVAGFSTIVSMAFPTADCFGVVSWVNSGTVVCVRRQCHRDPTADHRHVASGVSTQFRRAFVADV